MKFVGHRKVHSLDSRMDTSNLIQTWNSIFNTIFQQYEWNKNNTKQICDIEVNELTEHTWVNKNKNKNHYEYVASK